MTDYANLWPLIADNHYLVRLCSQVKLDEPSCGYDWRDEQIHGDLGTDDVLEWETRFPDGYLKPIDVEVFDDDYDGHADIHCHRCGTRLEHGQVVAKHMGTGEIICPLCTREDRVPRFYVAVYLVNKVFGGPEEGGWWFDAGELIDMHCYPTLDKARFHQRQFERIYSNEGRQPITNVNSEGEYRVQIDRTRPPEFFPERKPHYE